MIYFGSWMAAVVQRKQNLFVFGPKDPADAAFPKLDL